MKLVIKKGTSVENAMKSISEFLLDNYSDYPIIKNTMNVYIALENENGQICPDNEKEFSITQEEVKDVMEEEKNIKLNEILDDWQSLRTHHSNRLERLEREVANDVAYLDRAKENGRKESNIAKRKKQHEKNKEELEEERKTNEKIILFDNAINENNFTVCFTKYTDRRSPYKYRLDVMLVFKDVDGYNGYFNGYSGHFNRRGFGRGLYDGLPLT